jgi:hypothetical protein
VKTDKTSNVFSRIPSFNAKGRSVKEVNLGSSRPTPLHTPAKVIHYLLASLAPFPLNILHPPTNRTWVL